MPVSERLPDKDGYFSVITDYGNHKCERFYQHSIKAFFNYDGYKVTHWLEKKENIYPLTQEQLDKIVSDAFDAGKSFEWAEQFGQVPNPNKNKEQYLSNLNKQP